MKYIILNFAYGYGPFLRTAELALAVNRLMEKNGRSRFGIIVPWVYGARQKQIMAEEFSEAIRKRPGEILLDKKLGAYLKSIFYGEKGYQASLVYYLANYKKIERRLASYFSRGLRAETFGGEKMAIKKKDIAFAITRSPRISFPVKLSYDSSFAFISEIMERALKISAVAADKKILAKLIPLYRRVEKKHTLHFIAEPATFSYLKNRPRLYQTEISTPPNAARPKKIGSKNKIKPGIYVTVTGIPGLKRLFKEARRIGLKIYTNNPDAVAGGEKASPRLLTSGRIRLHFARSGWGSVWLSQFCGVPFVAPKYDKNDDPEIYFNNLCLEKLGLGKIYRGQSLGRLLRFRGAYERNVKKINQALIKKYGRLDGVSYAAEKIMANYFNSNL